MSSKSLPQAAGAPKLDFQALAGDFKNLNPKDPGIWPMAPKIVLLLILLVAIIGVGWLVLWKEQLAELEGKQQETERLKQEFVEKKRQAVNLDLYVQQLAEIDRSFGALLKQLPNKSEVDALLIDVNQSGLGRGLQFERFAPGSEMGKEFYAELPVAVKVTGSYHDIGAFASDIAKLPRIVTLNNISLTPNKDKESGASGLLTLEATIKTFRYLDEQEMAKQKKGSQGKGSQGKGSQGAKK